jgi:hypothetical protein
MIHVTGYSWWTWWTSAGLGKYLSTFSVLFQYFTRYLQTTSWVYFILLFAFGRSTGRLLSLISMFEVVDDSNAIWVPS